MQSPEDHPQDESGKLRRWVSNLQLESWQLELLITGFSIFLLATSLDGYEEFRRDIIFNKLDPDAGTISRPVAVSLKVIISAIPLILKFLLINLLVHLLLRGFWIGIVGLSSVSSTIYIERLNLKGKFKKFIAANVKSLDGLIVYLDKISSVIFAYTYLMVFSILSVVIVTSIIFSTAGLTAWLTAQGEGAPLVLVLNFTLFMVIVLMIIGAIIFFLDTLLFSAFKKSKWFSSIYYPIYRFYSVISLSILYRSIYYHLITNFKKKQIISVVAVLLLLSFAYNRITGWNNYKFYPTDGVISESFMSNNMYDDTRGDAYITRASIPSKFVKRGYLELFLRYDPSDNELLGFLCPDANALFRGTSFREAFRDGMRAQSDSLDSQDRPSYRELYREKVGVSAGCMAEMYEIQIDEKVIDMVPMIFQAHQNKGEKGYLLIFDISWLERGRHTLQIKKLDDNGTGFLQEIEEGNLEMELYVKMNFWTE